MTFKQLTKVEITTNVLNISISPEFHNQWTPSVKNVDFKHTFTGVSVLPQVVALATVALVWAIDVGALVAAGIFVTFIDVWAPKRKYMFSIYCIISYYFFCSGKKSFGNTKSILWHSLSVVLGWFLLASNVSWQLLRTVTVLFFFIHFHQTGRNNLIKTW